MTEMMTGNPGLQAAPEGTCPCGHPDSGHDLVAARYCRATISGALQRGCICPGRDPIPASGS